MQRLRTAIIGTGKVAHIHAAALQSLPESNFTAICGTPTPETKAFAEKYNVACYTDLEKFARESKCDAVAICTPHPQHADPAVICAQNKMHLLIEKPLASSLADCDKILAAAALNNLLVSTVSQRRFYPACQRIHAAITKNKSNQPILGNITMYGNRNQAYYKSDPWRGSWQHEGGGVLVNQAPHQLDLLLWFMNSPVTHLSGMWANLNHPYIEVEDTAIANVRFASGALAQILVTNAADPALYGRVQINTHSGASLGVQTDGGAMFIAGVTKIKEAPINDTWTIEGESHLKEKWITEDTAHFNAIDPIAYYHTMQIKDFLQAIIDNRPPLITGEDGRRTVELFTAIYRSQENNGAAIQFPLK